APRAGGAVDFPAPASLSRSEHRREGRGGGIAVACTPRSGCRTTEHSTQDQPDSFQTERPPPRGRGAGAASLGRPFLGTARLARDMGSEIWRAAETVLSD